MRLAPCFDRPYCSATFAEFWSQRWNVTTTYLFRVLIYDPIVEGRLVAAVPQTVASAITAHTAAAGCQMPRTPDSSDLSNANNQNRGCHHLPERPRQHAKVGIQAASAEKLLHSMNGEKRTRDVTQTCDQNDAVATNLGQNLVQGPTAQGRKMFAKRNSKDALAASASDSPINLGQDCSTTHSSNSSQSGTGDRTATSNIRRLIGMQATFAVSAAWHVLLYWLLTGTIGWQWPLFFLIQGPIVAAESMMRKALKDVSVTVPLPVAIACTNVLLIMLADPLLITPLVDSRVVARMFGQAGALAQQLGQGLVGM